MFIIVQNFLAPSCSFPSVSPPHEKRSRLVHLPIIVSVRKPQKGFLKKHRKVLKILNLVYKILLVKGQISQKKKMAIFVPIGC